GVPGPIDLRDGVSVTCDVLVGAELVGHPASREFCEAGIVTRGLDVLLVGLEFLQEGFAVESAAGDSQRILVIRESLHQLHVLRLQTRQRLLCLSPVQHAVRRCLRILGHTSTCLGSSPMNRISPELKSFASLTVHVCESLAALLLTRKLKRSAEYTVPPSLRTCARKSESSPRRASGNLYRLKTSRRPQNVAPRMKSVCRCEWPMYVRTVESLSSK